MKKLIVFDLEGTLAESKSSLDKEMSELLYDLLGIVKVAVISGGDWSQFEKQVLSNLPHGERLANLFIYSGNRKKVYSEDFTSEERDKIVGFLKKAIGVAGFNAQKVWVEIFKDRGNQITFSALGENAPVEEKNNWDSDSAKREKVKAILDTFIPQFSVQVSGATSIDITKQDINNAYRIRKLRDLLGISLKEMIFVGDAMYGGGSDYPVKEAGVISIMVRCPNETKQIIKAIIACLDYNDCMI